MKVVKANLGARKVNIVIKGLKHLLMFIHIRRFDMSAVSLNVKQWGNSLGIRLPAAIAKAVGPNVKM